MFLDPLNLVREGGWAQYKITAMTYDPLIVAKIGPKLWEMRTTFPGCLYRWTWDLGPCTMLVPTGYRCDGASIPKPYRGIVDPEAAFDWSWVHDLLYEAHGGDRPFRVWHDDGTFDLKKISNEKNPVLISRERADAILICGWISNGMKRLEALAGYSAVRQFGDHAWEMEV